MVFLSVCFLTLIERKILGYVQNRKGPNKLIFLGLIQPVIDGGKLLLKLIFTNFILMFIPFLLIVFVGVIAQVIRYEWLAYRNNLVFIYVIVVRIFIVYFIFLLGWLSENIYGILGGLRSSSQIVAYEIIMFFIFIIIFIFNLSLSWKLTFNVLYIIDFFLIWILVIVIETNRRPYDFAEGESELVSGYNIEYMGVLFAFIFIAEYGIIVFFSWVTSYLFFRSYHFYFILFLVVIIRGFIPRRRYDNLIYRCWKFIFILVSFIFLKFFLI